jgi:predicted lipoprotein with Yx(FWY)xxD motif
MNHTKISLAIFMLAVTIFSSCDKEETVDTELVPKIVLANHATYGKILTDENGISLYFFSKDASGASVCLDGCLNSWPIYYSETPEIGDGLSASDFGTIDHPSRTKQTTYKGWPLYYYSPTKDAVKEAAGSTAGEAVGGVWFLAKPDYSIMIAKSQLIGANGINYLGDYTEGTGETFYFTDAMGRTLYTFQNDTKNDNNFTKEDFSNDGSWPIFHVALEKLPSTLNSSDFGEIDVFSKKQLTYKGWPVYYYGSDAMRGQNKGVSVPVAGKWPIINASIAAAQ